MHCLFLTGQFTKLNFCSLTGWMCKKWQDCMISYFRTRVSTHRISQASLSLNKAKYRQVLQDQSTIHFKSWKIKFDWGKNNSLATRHCQRCTKIMCFSLHETLPECSTTFICSLICQSGCIYTRQCLKHQAHWYWETVYENNCKFS